MPYIYQAVSDGTRAVYIGPEIVIAQQQTDHRDGANSEPKVSNGIALNICAREDISSAQALEQDAQNQSQRTTIVADQRYAGCDRVRKQHARYVYHPRRLGQHNSSRLPTFSRLSGAERANAQVKESIIVFAFTHNTSRCVCNSSECGAAMMSRKLGAEHTLRDTMYRFADNYNGS